MSSATPRRKRFQSPRICLALIVCGLGIEELASRQMAAKHAVTVREIARIDSALVASQPRAADRLAEPTPELLALVAQKRDAERSTFSPLLYLGRSVGSGMLFAAFIVGGLALLDRVRGRE